MNGFIVILVQDGRDGTEHLQQEGFPVQHVELLAHVLHCAGDQFVGLVVGVDAQQAGHHKEVPVQVMRMFKMCVGMFVLVLFFYPLLAKMFLN